MAGDFFVKRIDEITVQMQAPCKGCMFFTGDMCNYLGIVGRRRPSPPGARCTVKVPGRRLKVLPAGVMPGAPLVLKKNNDGKVDPQRAPMLARLYYDPRTEKLYNQGRNDGEISRAMGVGIKVVVRWRQLTGRKANAGAGHPRKREG